MPFSSKDFGKARAQKQYVLEKVISDKENIGKGLPPISVTNNLDRK
jgi:hypothetical protein